VEDEDGTAMVTQREQHSDSSLELARLLEPEIQADPYPFYRRLRETAPVHWNEWSDGGGSWVLTRHADVMAALRDARMTAARTGPALQAEWLPEEYQDAARKVFRAMPHQLLFLDPPDHTRLRGLVSKAFTPRLVEGMRLRIRDLAETLLGGVYERGHMEVIAELAYPLPAIVIAELLGVPAQDREQFIRWSSDFGAVLDGSSLTPEQAMQALVGVSEFMDYFRAIVAARADAPRDDLLQALLAAREREDVLSEDELLANLVLILAAGHGTTTHLIGNGLLALLHNPDEYARMCRELELAATATQELLRYDSPVQLTGRTAREDITLGGQAVKAGERVTVILGAANRDPAVFSEPDRLDLTRQENRHMAFGQGIHFCLGAPLARVEAEEVLKAVSRRLPDLRLDFAEGTQPEYRPSVVFRGLNELPVAWG
jgi:cytochrome P450